MKQIIIVDDDAGIVAMCMAILGGKGLFVRGYCDPRIAFQEMTAECGCLLTDNDMLGMNGLELVAKVRRKFPGIKVVMMSGELTEAEALQGGANHFLKKPFRHDQLIELIAAVIAPAI